jgi:hypothetical protein
MRVPAGCRDPALGGNAENKKWKDILVSEKRGGERSGGGEWCKTLNLKALESVAEQWRGGSFFVSEKRTFSGVAQIPIKNVTRSGRAASMEGVAITR